MTKLADIKQARNRLEFRLKQLPPIREPIELLLRVASSDRELAGSARDCLAAIKNLETEAQTLVELLHQRVVEST